MKPLKENPRLITLLMLIIAFVYCARFTRGIREEITNYNHNSEATQIESAEIAESPESFSDTVNHVAKIVSERIEQAIRQTSHLIGS